MLIVSNKKGHAPRDLLVGVAGLEPTTSLPPAKRATKLRHTPNVAESLADGLSRYKFYCGIPEVY